jgi:hypothetical protein
MMSCGRLGFSASFRTRWPYGEALRVHRARAPHGALSEKVCCSLFLDNVYFCADEGMASGLFHRFAVLLPAAVSFAMASVFMELSRLRVVAVSLKR